MTVCKGDSASCWDPDVLAGPPRFLGVLGAAGRFQNTGVFIGKESRMSLEWSNTW